MDLAAAGDANLLRREQESVETEHAQAAPRIERPARFERRSGNWNEKIHRDTAHAELAQRQRQVDDVIVASLPCR